MAKKPSKKAGKLTPIREVSHYEIRHVDTKEVVGKSANQMSAQKALKRYGSKQHYSSPVYKDDIEAEKKAKKAERENERQKKREQEEARKKAERDKNNAILAKKREKAKAEREAERNSKKAEREAKRKPKTKWGLDEKEYELYLKETIKKQKSSNKKDPIKNKKGKFTSDVEEIVDLVMTNGHKMNSAERRKHLNFLRPKIPRDRYNQILDSLPEAEDSNTSGIRESGSKTYRERIRRERENRDTNDVIKGRPRENEYTNTNNANKPNDQQTTSNNDNDTNKPPRFRRIRGFGRGIRNFAGGLKGGMGDITRNAASHMWHQYKRNFKRVLLHGGEGQYGHAVDRRFKQTWLGSRAGITNSTGGTNTAKTMGSGGGRTRITDGINRINAQLEDVVLSNRRIENTLNKLLYAQNNNGKDQASTVREDENGKPDENRRNNWRGLLGGPRPTGSGSTRAARNGIRFGRGLVRYGGPALAVIGGGLAAADEFGQSGDAGRAASVGAGSTGGALAGGILGMKAGALAGSLGGPVGTVIGGLGGMVLGGYLGSKGGEAAGRYGYDALTQSGRETEQALRNNEARNRLVNNANSAMDISTFTYSVNARSDILFSTPTKLHFKAASIVFEGTVTNSSNATTNATPNTSNTSNTPNTQSTVPQILPNGGQGGNQQTTPGGSSTPNQGFASGARRANVFDGGNAGGDRGIAQSTVTGPQRPVIPGFGNNIGGGLFGAIPNGRANDNQQGTSQNAPNANTPSSLMMRSIMSAETGNLGSPTDPRRFIRTRVTPEQNHGAPGDRHSSAYGPNQLTKTWLEEFRNRHGASLPREEREYLDGLIAQGARMLETSRRGNRNDPVHGFGGTGTMGQTERQRQLYGQIAQRGMIDAVRNSRSYENFIQRYRGVNDQGYFQKIQREARRLGTTPEELYNRMRTMNPSDLPALPDPNAANQQGSSPNNGPTPSQSQMRSIPGFNIQGRPDLGNMPLSPDQSQQRQTPSAGGWHMPSSGTVNSQYGMRTFRGRTRMHGGTDIRPPTRGELVGVHAMRDGKITAINGDGDVTIKHDNGYTTTYRHINPEGLRVDQPVTGGQRIGQLRRHDSRSSGPHLHLEVRDPRGRRINPSEIIPEFGVNGSRMTGGQAYGPPATAPQTETQQGTSRIPEGLSYRSEILKPDERRSDQSAIANGQRSNDEMMALAGTYGTQAGRNNLQGAGESYIHQRRQQNPIINGQRSNDEMMALATPRAIPQRARPFQPLPEDGMIQTPTQLGINNLQTTGRNFIDQRRQQNAIANGQRSNDEMMALATPREAPQRARPFQSLPEDGMIQTPTQLGINNLQATGASFIEQRRQQAAIARQAAQVQMAQRSIEDGKQANKIALEQSIPPLSGLRGAPSATESTRPTTPQSNAPTRMTAPSETATPSGRFAEEIHSRGSGAIVEPIENSNMSLQKSANKISQ